MHYSRPSDFERFVLKEDSDSVEVDTSEACRLAAFSMLRQAARSVEIVSRGLDPQIYDNAEFCDAVSQLVVGSRRARVRVLIRDVEPVVKSGHRLVPIAQRLPTFIELRVPAREYDEYNSAFLVVDGAGVIYRRLSDRFEATVNFNNPHMARDLVRQFEEMWQTAVPDINLRRSHL
ncbi:MAG: hypothetical protein GTO67_00725 [Gammaproteobacteria bacterium]|nr:hypothetical protein [Gammaproteobacteria bacterium]NIM72418.1 hypothetical protein [Gammaproteobacteria bacterium]NIN37285.1 hypothetical protein [Gammaproteobacteria bacterium]NIO24175.1 hypothetical protein [Gammaproteobacteria bacterium]NIO64782.1 hypothetical protein [Gammaproteobacteria bacterium]